MILHIAETLSCGSIESFLFEDEVVKLQMIMKEITATSQPLVGLQRETSIHEVPGLTSKQVQEIYEPLGRLELVDIPKEAAEILAQACKRAMPKILRQFPSVDAIRPWVYVEYGLGQYITPHTDGIAPDSSKFPKQVAGISVCISNADSGGQFFIETTSCQEQWDEKSSEELGMSFIREGSDNSSSWFREVRRTRWVVNPALGDALLYGSQLVHGTLPVIEGTVCKFISWCVQTEE